MVPGVWCELVVASDPVAGLGQRNRNYPPQTGQFLGESVGPEVRIFGWVVLHTCPNLTLPGQTDRAK